MRTHTLRTRLKQPKKKPYGLIAFVAALVVISLTGLAISVSHAATYSVALEAENGALSTATASTVPGASGKAVTFAAAGGGGVPKTGGCVAPAGLKPTDLDAAHGGTDQIPAWRHKNGDAAVIYYAVSALTPEYAGYIRDGAAVWNVSPCVDIKVVDTCPAASNCVVAQKTDSSLGATVDGQFAGVGNSAYTYLKSGTITLVSALLDTEPADYRKLVTIHEMGHSVSLGHRLTSNDLMYWSSGLSAPLTADTTNLNNILAVYGVQSAATTTSLTEGGSDGDTVVRTYE